MVIVLLSSYTFCVLEVYRSLSIFQIIDSCGEERKYQVNYLFVFNYFC